MSMEGFFTLHSDLPREGPGDRASLDAALAPLNLPGDARILDAGCGPGGDIEGLLAHVPRGHVLALEIHAPYVAAVRARFPGDVRVSVAEGDMLRAEGPFDLIWSAGAVYLVGVEEALQAWRAALAPGGHVAFSEIVWLTDDPPGEARRFWAAYPQMRDLPGLRAAVARAGYRISSETILPDAAWEAYFQPLEARMARLRAGRPVDADLAAAMAEQKDEIALWRRHRRAFGYALIVAAPA